MTSPKGALLGVDDVCESVSLGLRVHASVPIVREAQNRWFSGKLFEISQSYSCAFPQRTDSAGARSENQWLCAIQSDISRNPYALHCTNFQSLSKCIIKSRRLLVVVFWEKCSKHIIE